jgi:hypothetical protein
LSHFHLKYFPRTGTPKTNYGASFFSEIEALDAAGLANVTRGAETGYYGIQLCHRKGCCPVAPNGEIEAPKAQDGPPAVRIRRLTRVLH